MGISLHIVLFCFNDTLISPLIALDERIKTDKKVADLRPPNPSAR
jgi:hypothetical protein